MKKKEQEEKKPFVTASEIADYTYCPEAWRLGSGLKLKGKNTTRLEQGTLAHTRWERKGRFLRRLLITGVLLLGIAFILRLQF